MYTAPWCAVSSWAGLEKETAAGRRAGGIPTAGIKLNREEKSVWTMRYNIYILSLKKDRKILLKSVTWKYSSQNRGKKRSLNYGSGWMSSVCEQENVFLWGLKRTLITETRAWQSLVSWRVCEGLNMMLSTVIYHVWLLLCWGTGGLRLSAWVSQKYVLWRFCSASVRTSLCFIQHFKAGKKDLKDTSVRCSEWLWIPQELAKEYIDVCLFCQFLPQ